MCLSDLGWREDKNSPGGAETPARAGPGREQGCHGFGVWGCSSCPHHVSLVPQFPLQLGGEGEESPCDETQDVSAAAAVVQVSTGPSWGTPLFPAPLSSSSSQPGAARADPHHCGAGPFPGAPRCPPALGAVALTPCFTPARCSGAYVGERCQLPNPCLSSPCKNAGTCTALVRGGTADYTCACRLGFTDELCLTPRDNVCLSNPCRNGGTCELLTLSEYKCRCPPGWSGQRWHLGTWEGWFVTGEVRLGVRRRFFMEKRDKGVEWCAQGGGVTVTGAG